MNYHSTENPVKGEATPKFRNFYQGRQTASTERGPIFFASLVESSTNPKDGSLINFRQCKVTFYDEDQNTLTGVKAAMIRQCRFVRHGFDGLPELAHVLRHQQGRYALLTGDFASAADEHEGPRKQEKGEDPLFLDRPSRLLAIDVDRAEPDAVDPDYWTESNPFDLLNVKHLEHLARCLIRAIAPGNEECDLIIALTGSASRNRVKFRLFVLTDKPLTLAERRSLCGPGLESISKNSSIHSSVPGFGLDFALTHAVNNLIYIATRAWVVKGEGRPNFARYMDRIKEQAGGSDSIGTNRLNFLAYHGQRFRPDNIVQEDPLAKHRVLFRPGTRPHIEITESLIDPSRIPARPKHKSKSEKLAAMPLRPEERAALDCAELEDIGGGTGSTYQQMRDYAFRQANLALKEWRPFDAALTERAIAERLMMVREEQKAAGNRDRVDAINGYLQRDLGRIMESAKRFHDERRAEIDATGNGYSVIEGEDDESESQTIYGLQDAPMATEFLSPQQGEERLRDGLTTFADRLATHESGTALLIKGTVGLGKSEAMHKMILKHLEKHADPVAIIVPTHKMANEHLAAFNAVKPGLAVVYRGKDYTDPTGAEYCGISQTDRKSWNGARGSTLAACHPCRFKDDHPSNDGPCPYFYQGKAFETARIHIFTGKKAMLNSIPEMVREKTAWTPLDGETEDDIAERAAAAGLSRPSQYAAVILDESQIHNWIERDEFRLDKMAQTVESNAWIAPDTKRNMPKENALDIVNKAIDALFKDAETKIEPGYIYRLETTEGHGDFPMKRGEVVRFVEALNRLKIHADDDDAKRVFGAVEPAMRRDARKTLKRKSAYCRQIYSLYEAAIALLAGGSVTVESAGEKPCVIWSYKAIVHRHWHGSNLLILDATADETIVRLWFPELEVSSINVRDAQGFRRFLLSGDAVSYTRIAKERQAVVSEVQAAIGGLKKAHAEPKSLEQSVGFIGPLDLIKGAFAAAEEREERDESAVLPEHSAVRASDNADGRHMVANFNNVRGFNYFEQVRCLLVAGRPLPRRDRLEREAADLKGEAVIGADPGKPWPRSMRPVFVRDADGTIHEGTAECWTHPDPIARALLDETTPAEITQADGRARGIRRGHWRNGKGADLATVFHATGTAVPGMVYDRLLDGYVEMMNRDKATIAPVVMELDSIRDDTPQGRVFIAYLQGECAEDRAGWAEIAGLTETQYHDLKTKHPELNVVEFAARHRRDDSRQIAALIQAEEMAEPRSYREIAEAMLADGRNLKDKACTGLCRAEIEASGREFKADSWRNARALCLQKRDLIH